MQIKFNRIYIIESLQIGDKLTGTDLYNDLLKWKSFLHPDFKAVLKNISNRRSFFALFDELLKECVNEGVSPILHFEIHGALDQTGLVLTNKEPIQWNELADKLRPLNIQLKNGLFITMGVCHGCYFLSKDVVSKSSLFQGIIASFDNLYNGSIYVQFLAFYEELFTSFDINKAYVKLIEANPEDGNIEQKLNYCCYSSEYIFAMVQADYDDKQCSEEAFKQRALNEIAKGQLTFINRQDKRKKIREFVKLGRKKKGEYFAKAYRTYFMLDKYPELAKNISYPCNMQEMKQWLHNFENLKSYKDGKQS